MTTPAPAIYWAVTGTGQPDISATPFSPNFITLPQGGSEGEICAMPSDISQASVDLVINSVTAALGYRGVGEFDRNLISPDLEPYSPSSVAGKRIEEFYLRLVCDTIKSFRTQSIVSMYAHHRASYYLAVSDVNFTGRMQLRNKQETLAASIRANDQPMFEMFFFDNDQDKADRQVDFNCTEAIRICGGRRPVVVVSPIFLSGPGTEGLVGQFMDTDLELRIMERCINWGVDVAIFGHVGDYGIDTTAWQGYVDRYAGYFIPRPPVVATSDIVVLPVGSGIIIPSPNGHYWRFAIDNSGMPQAVDLGTTPPGM